MKDIKITMLSHSLSASPRLPLQSLHNAIAKAVCSGPHRQRPSSCFKTLTLNTKALSTKGLERSSAVGRLVAATEVVETGVFKMRSTWLCLTQLLTTLLLPLVATADCPPPCSCVDGTVTCSGRGLTSSALPSAFPADTTKIHLHDNQLTWVPTGLLDGLADLRSVSLHGNPWACDCAVLYLRGWLLKRSERSLYGNVTCSSPPRLRGRLVVYLTEDEVLDTCQYWYCDLALTSQIVLFVLILLQAVLLAFLIYFLRRYENLSRVTRHTVEESFAGGEIENEYTTLKERSD
ncbi:hypothetical protein GJAV_G00035500 [Gymnothorax javanicus]|nr:hypothetical protein GJAV_G00035500 [Gymnothorax javanicus]